MTDAEFMLAWAEQRRGDLYIPRAVLDALEAMANLSCLDCAEWYGSTKTPPPCTSELCVALRKFRAAMEGLKP